MTGLQTSCGLLGPTAECRNNVGMKQSQVSSVMKFHIFLRDGASHAVHVGAIQTVVIVTMCSTW